MFNRPTRKKTELEKALDKALIELDKHQVDSKEYPEILDRIAKLHKMAAEDKPKSVSPDTQAMIAANLLSVLIIISYEHSHVITSKATTFVSKLK